MQYFLGILIPTKDQCKTRKIAGFVVPECFANIQEKIDPIFYA